MPSEVAADSPGPDGEAPTVNLVLLSPSVGVPQPFRLNELPAETSVKQLKERIREALPHRPGEDNQRLIVRGRALIKEDETLLQIFGAEALKNDTHQSIHLVLRDVPNASSQPIVTPAPTTSTTIPARDTSPAPSNTSSAPNMRQHTSSPQQQYLNMVQRRMLQAQREAMQVHVNHNQRGRASMGMRGIGDNMPGPRSTTSHSPVPVSRSRHASPAPGQPIFHDPNGQRYTTGMPSPYGMSPTELQNILQGADATQATYTMTNAMNAAMNNSSVRRSASAAPLESRRPIQPGVTTPIMPGSGRTTPTNTSRFVPPPTQGAAQEVYILWSPEGPRALLVNNNTQETYYTPRLNTQRSMPRMNLSPYGGLLPPEAQITPASGVQYPVPAPQPRNRHTPTETHGSQEQQQQQQQPQPQPDQDRQREQEQARVQAQIAQNLGHAHIAPPVIPPLVRMVWPHLWLMLRLSLFVYLFTSPNATWSRWLLMIGLAVFIFVLSTGALNNLADLVGRPIARHIDGLMPQIDGQRRQNAQQGQNQGDAAAATAGNDQQQQQPAQMAARLVEQQRQDQPGWLAGQFRRVERASLLFLASIAPGVAERHIANMEAEERRLREEEERRQREEEEKRRQKEEADEAAAAAAVASSDASNDVADGEKQTDTEQASTSATEVRGDEGQERQQGQGRGDLIAM